MQSCIYTFNALMCAISYNPLGWQRLVLTNGYFDLVDVGHVLYLEAAYTMGRSPVVGLNHDASVQTFNASSPLSPQRSIIPQHNRIPVLAALKRVGAAAVLMASLLAAQSQHSNPIGIAKGVTTRLSRSLSPRGLNKSNRRLELVPT